MPLNVPNQRILIKKLVYLWYYNVVMARFAFRNKCTQNIIRCNLLNVKYFNLPDLNEFGP